MSLRDHIARALTARQDGRLPTALAEGRALIALDPGNFTFHQFIGEVCVEMGDAAQALQAYEQAANLAPREPTLHRAVALLAMATGHPRLAADHLSALDRHTADDIANLADALAAAGDHAAAIAAYDRLCRLRPKSPDALVALASQFIKANRHAEAEAVLRRALALAPDDAGALTDLGLVILARGEAENAVPLLERAAGRPSPSLASLVALANARQSAGQSVGALDAARAAQSLAPAGDLHVNFALAAALTTLGQGAEAVSLLRQAVDANRDSRLPVLDIVRSRLLFSLQYLSDLPPSDMLAEARRCAGPMLRDIRPLAAAPRPPGPDRRLRVGYVSTDFREHACRYYLEPLIASHDREAVEVFCYAEVASPDQVTERFRALADHWRSSVGLDDSALAGMIRADGIDILVDLCGHAARNRIRVFAYRPAPVQVATLIGYSATTGLDVFDGLLGDPHLTPPGCDADFSEPIIRLPRIIAPFMPRTDWPEALDQTGPDIVFGCVAEAARVDERTMAVWRRLLERVPRSRILFKQAQFNDEPTRLAWVNRLGDLAERVDLEGIPGGWSRNMEVYSRLGMVLDSPLHSGNTTVLIPLWMGVPVVTLAGPNSWQRAGASILANAGLADLIATNDEHYVEIAAGLAADSQRRRQLRRDLRAMMRASPVCDARPVVAEIEAAYRRLWRSHGSSGP